MPNTVRRHCVLTAKPAKFYRAFIEPDAMSKPAEIPASLWTYCFRVAEGNEAVRRTNGGDDNVVHGPMPIPGGEFAVNAVDPQGAMFAFVDPRK